MQYITGSAYETKKLAEKLARKVHGVVALIGRLGTGKTTFVQGFARGLGIRDKIISPTFVLMRQHKIPNSNKTLYHIDLYRIEKDFNQFGLKEILENPENIVLIEWAEKLKNLPKNTKKIVIQSIGQNKRIVTLS